MDLDCINGVDGDSYSRIVFSINVRLEIVVLFFFGDGSLLPRHLFTWVTYHRNRNFDVSTFPGEELLQIRTD